MRKKARKKSGNYVMKAVAGASFSDYGNPIDPLIGSILADNAWMAYDEMPTPKAFTKQPQLGNFDYQTPAEALGDVQFDTGNPTKKGSPKKKYNYGAIAAGTLAAIDALIPNPDKISNPVVQPLDSYNPNPYGTGSQAIGKSGIHIKKSKRGTLHDAVGVKRGEKIPASKLEIHEGDSPALKKKKQFAKNAKKWKHEAGGPIDLDSGGHLSASKAKEMLRDGTAHGKKLTTKQKHYFGMVAAGKADAGLAIGDPPIKGPDDPTVKNMGKPLEFNFQGKYKDPYYEASATLSFYKDILNEKLKQKNPKAFADYFKGIRTAKNRNEYVQNTPYDEYLSPEEVQKTLGGHYANYVSSVRAVNKYNLSQGEQPLYGNVEGEDDITKLNYGRRFASLQVTPKVSNTVKSVTGENRTYTRNYFFDPNKGAVDYTEEGDMRAAPSYLKPRASVAKMEKGGKLYDSSDIHPIASDSYPSGAKNRKGKINMEAGGYIKKLSHNPFDGGTIEFVGKSHEEGGIDIAYGGKKVEVEGGEPATLSPDGTLNIMGNMKVPGTNTKFKQVSKRLAKKELEYSKINDKGSRIMNSTDPTFKEDRLSFNTGKVLVEGAMRGMSDIQKKKQLLTAMQDSLLQEADNQGIDPISFSEGGRKKAKYGAKITFDGGGKLSMAKRMRNPGNIKYGEFARKFGAVKGEPAKDGGYFAEFPNVNSGMQALKSLLKSKNYKDLPAKEAIDRWTNKAGYASNKLGDLNNKTIASMNDQEFNQLVNTITFGEDGKYYDGSDATDPTPTSNQGMPSNLDPVYRGGYKAPNVPFNPAAQKAPDPNIINPDELDPANITKKKYLPSNAEGLDWKQLAPELLALGTNKPQSVFMQTYQPDLFTPYNVDLQDRRNSNTSTFNALQRMASDSPIALASLAAQKYDADNQVNAEEFRINQGIESDVTNKNVGLLNDAKLKNLAMADTQYTRQATALSKTKAQNQLIANSIAGKYLQNTANNRKLAIYENLYDYRFTDENKDGVASEATYMGDDPTWNFMSGNNTNGQGRYTSTSVEKDRLGNIKKTRERTMSEIQAETAELKKRDLESKIPIFRAYKLGGIHL